MDVHIVVFACMTCSSSYLHQPAYSTESLIQFCLIRLLSHIPSYRQIHNTAQADQKIHLIPLRIKQGRTFTHSNSTRAPRAARFAIGLVSRPAGDITTADGLDLDVCEASLLGTGCQVGRRQMVEMTFLLGGKTIRVAFAADGCGGDTAESEVSGRRWVFFLRILRDRLGGAAFRLEGAGRGRKTFD